MCNNSDLFSFLLPSLFFNFFNSSVKFFFKRSDCAAERRIELSHGLLPVPPRFAASGARVSSQNTKEEVTKQRERKSVNVDVRARVCT